MKYTFTFTARLSPDTELIYETKVESRHPQGSDFSYAEAATKAARRLIRDVGDRFSWQLATTETEAS